MSNRKLRLLYWPLGAALGLAVAVIVVAAAPSATIQGRVIDENGPVSGATVRIQATSKSTSSSADGEFVLNDLSEAIPVTVSAWKEGYYCAKVEGVTPPTTDVLITLQRYQTNDNPDYEWVLPTGVNSCYSCKPGVTQIWLDSDAHASSGSNPRFFSMYNGSDLTGAHTIAPGYKLDFPGTAGNCATCHAPGAALDAPFTTDMNSLPEIDRDFGVHCDYCHKVADVFLNPSDGLPYPNAPGALSMDIRRPFPEAEYYQLFFGTFDDDNVPEEDTYLPLIERSQWCAPCHQFSFWGTPIYQSYQEWLESPYPDLGIECQTCHMPSDGLMTNVAPGHGGVERDPATIHAHTMPGASAQDLLQNTVQARIESEPLAGAVVVTVTLTNYGAGHHAPTDHPGRQLILEVTVRNSDDSYLELIDGPILPAWSGGLSDRPGVAYAKILQDIETGAYPVASYWKPSRIISDNRIPAMEDAISTYLFQTPPEGSQITISARLRFRRMFQAEMEERGWSTADLMMEEEQTSLATQAYSSCYFPVCVQTYP